MPRPEPPGALTGLPPVLGAALALGKTFEVAEAAGAGAGGASVVTGAGAGAGVDVDGVGAGGGEGGAIEDDSVVDGAAVDATLVSVGLSSVLEVVPRTVDEGVAEVARVSVETTFPLLSTQTTTAGSVGEAVT